jgi:hypothetical protein
MTIGGGAKAQKVKPTLSQKALAVIAAKKWQDYQTRLLPVEKQANAALLRRGRPGYREQLAGINAAAVNQATPGPTGTSLAESASRTLQRGSALGVGGTDAELQSRERGQNAYGTIMARGRHVEGAGIQALTHQAAAERARAIGKAQAESIKSQGWSQLAGGLAGFGLSRFASGGGLGAGGATPAAGSASPVNPAVAAQYAPDLTRLGIR